MDNLVIRTYVDKDEATVVNLWKDCNLTVPWNNPYSDIARKVADSSHLFFVGELNDNIVATCMAGYDGHRGWIYYLAVRPGLQGRCIATKLLKHSENALADLGCPKIDLMVRKTNEKVLGFYRNAGYSDDPVLVLSKRLAEDAPYETKA